MSFNNIHNLKPNLSQVEKIIFGFDCLGNRVPVDSYLVSIDDLTESNTVEPQSDSTSSEPKHEALHTDYVDATPADWKRQTGGIISARNFPQQT